jgi:hypothetical protein
MKNMKIKSIGQRKRRRKKNRSKKGRGITEDRKRKRNI